MEQDTNSEISTSNSQDNPIAPEIESKFSDASLSSSTVCHHQSLSPNEEVSSDHEQSPASHSSSTQQSQEGKPSLSLLPHPQHHEQSSASHSSFTPQSQEMKPSLPLLPLPQHYSQSNSESEKPSSSSPDCPKPKSASSYKTGTGLLPFPSIPPISKRPPLLPFPPMRLPIRHQPMHPNILHNNIRQSQKPGLLPTPQRPFQSPFIRTPILDMQRSVPAEASNSDSKPISTESHLTTNPKTTKADSESTPTLSSLPPFFRYSILQDSLEPPSKTRKNAHTTDPSHLVTQHFVNPNQSYFPYNYPYQTNGYFPHMYQPGFLPPPGYFQQTSPSIHPTLSVPQPPPPPLPPLAPQPPLPPDPPRPPPPPPIYPTPPSPMPIHTTSPPPSPPSPQQLYPPPSPEIHTPPFQSSPFNPLATSTPNTSNYSSSSSLMRTLPPPPPPPQLAGEDKFISSFSYPQYLESSETSSSEIPLDHIPLPQ